MQKTSLRAPVNVKIDGKATEWGDQFQAYNHATEVYYTLSNNDDKLYLVIQARDPIIIQKMILGGITLTINNSGKIKDKNNKSITFPAYDKKNPPFYVILNNRPEILKDTIKYRMHTDSFMKARNDQLNEKLKLIGVTGMKTVTDSVISIYNEYGIKAAALFDHKIYCTYEIAIPLKYIGLTINDPGKFNYNIQLNGPNKGNIHVVEAQNGNMLTYTGGDGVEYGIGYATPENLILGYSTDFWGEYTLAKK